MRLLRSRRGIYGVLRCPNMIASRLEKTIQHDALLADTVQPIKILSALASPSFPKCAWNRSTTANRSEFLKPFSRNATGLILSIT